MYGASAKIQGEVFHVTSLAMRVGLNCSMQASITIDGIPPSLDKGMRIDIKFSNEQELTAFCLTFEEGLDNTTLIQLTDYLGMAPKIPFVSSATSSGDTTCDKFIAKAMKVEWGKVKPLASACWLAIDTTCLDLLNWVSAEHECAWRVEKDCIHFVPLTNQTPTQLEVLTKRRSSEGQRWELDCPYIAPGQWVQSDSDKGCVTSVTISIHDDSYSTQAIVGAPRAPAAPPQRGCGVYGGIIQDISQLTVALSGIHGRDQVVRGCWLEPRLNDFVLQIPAKSKDPVTVLLPLGISSGPMPVLPISAGVEAIGDQLTLTAVNASAHYKKLSTEVAESHALISGTTTVKTGRLDINEA